MPEDVVPGRGGIGAVIGDFMHIVAERLVALKAVEQVNGTADAHPIVVPIGDDQSGPVDRKHDVWERAVEPLPTSRQRVIRACFDQDVTAVDDVELRSVREGEAGRPV
jgi:hypothetical protein